MILAIARLICQTFLRTNDAPRYAALLSLGDFLSIKLLKIERNYDTRRNAARACGACICQKECIVYISNIIKIDTFGDA
jgi:hypothetical protein